MHEEERAELLCLRPEDVVFGIREVLRTCPAGGDARALEAKTLDAVLERFRREIGELQRHRRHPDEAVRVLRDDRGGAFILRLDDLAREAAILNAIPERTLLREQRDVDAVAIHPGDSLGADDAVTGCDRLPLERRAFHDPGDVGDVEMMVRVNHLDALAADGDLAPLRHRALLRPRETALRHEATGRRRRKSFDEITTIAHGNSPQLVGGWWFDAPPTGITSSMCPPGS